MTKKIYLFIVYDTVWKFTYFTMEKRDDNGFGFVWTKLIE